MWQCTIRNVFFIICTLFVCCVAGADDFVSVGSILNRAPDDTECSTTIFGNALRASAQSGAVDEDAHETDMQVWIYSVLESEDVLRDVLKCPEFANADDDDVIKLIPIQYTFPNGREIVVNYETQPTVLRQKMTIAGKRGLPAGPDSADLTAGDAIWTNVDPAWYAIMVTEHGALDKFVGADKNNTVSMKYINDNIDDLYPRGMTCTSKSALANDTYAINKAATQTVGLAESSGEKDTNDYYVAGDVDLGWIMYAEIALDVVITVATFGGGTVLAGVTKAARASKTLKHLKTKLNLLRGTENVINYNVKIPNRIKKLLKELDGIADIKQLSKTDDVVKYTQSQKQIADMTLEIYKLEGSTKAADIQKIAGLRKNLDDATAIVKDLENTENVQHYLKWSEVDSLRGELKKMEETDDVVRDYLKTMQTYEDVNKLRHELKGMRTLLGAKRGNVATRVFRGFKGIKASMGGAKTLNRGARIARSGLKSGRAKDWLFHSTMKHLARLGKVEATGGLLYGALKFAGDMYDYTETATGDFTNNIEFKPLLLLSADDLSGQENVINYGMWLLWAGDSVSAADDDAAYLQAMDFAAKFYQDLSEYQDETNSPCNVDIYVVRPIIRNPGDDNQELYYLIMNDEPWSTAND